MTLRKTIQKVLNESSGSLALQIEKLLNKKVKERYDRFVCRIEVIPPGNESFYASGQKTKKFIVRVVFKPLPDGDWVARDYAEKAIDECWDWVYDFMGIPVDVYSKHDSNCGQDSMIGLSESTFLKRRVNAEILEEAISDALNYAIFRFGEKYNRNLNQFINRVMSVLMDNLHPTLSWGDKEFPYDEIYEFLKEKYHDRIYNAYLKLRNIEPTKLETNESEITERCWKGYTQKGMKTMFGKRYPNCVKKTKK